MARLARLHSHSNLCFRILASFLFLCVSGDRYDANHPFHIHGHAFRVVAIDRLGRNVKVDKIRQLDKAGFIRRNLVDPPVKDTVSVPDGGYAAIRIHFNNPGTLNFHTPLIEQVTCETSIIFLTVSECQGIGSKIS